MEKQDLDKDFCEMDTREVVREAIREAFGNDDSLNVGNIENHCDQGLKDYYIGLTNGDEWAIQKQNEMLGRLLKDDRL